MNPPITFLTIGFIVLLLTSFVSAISCSIDGDWTKTSYTGNETMKFNGEISPTSGFVKISVLNPLGDEVYTLSERQITELFDVNIKTTTGYLNGTYRIRATYTKIANGTTCNEVLNVPVDLITSNRKGELELNITLSQAAATQPFSVDGPPVETPLGTITSKISGYGVPGLLPSIKLKGTSLAAGVSLGDIDIQLTQCNQNEQVLSSYQRVATFLNGSFADIVACQREQERLSGEQATCQNDLGLKRDEVTNLTGQVATWKTTAGSKWDWWMGLLLFLPIGFFLCVALRWWALKTEQPHENPPPPFEHMEGIIKL